MVVLGGGAGGCKGFGSSGRDLGDEVMEMMMRKRVMVEVVVEIEKMVVDLEVVDGVVVMG